MFYFFILAFPVIFGSPVSNISSRTFPSIVDNFHGEAPVIQVSQLNNRDTGFSPCCTRLSVSAEDQDVGAGLLLFRQLGTFTITNTLVRKRNSWVNDADPQFVITWCGNAWFIGGREEAGQCSGYVASSDNELCFEAARRFSYYVECIREWVDGEGSKLKVHCLDAGDSSGERKKESSVKEFGQGVGHHSHGGGGAIHEKLKQQTDLEIDPRNIDK